MSATQGEGSSLRSSHVSRSVRNAWFNGWSQVVGLGSSVGTSFLLARLAGAEALGLYSFSGGLSAVLIVVTSFAINTILTRDIAREPAAAARQVASALTFCLAVSLPLGVGTAAVVGGWLGLASDGYRVLVLFSALQGLRNGRGIFYAAYQGLSRFGTILAIESACLIATLSVGGAALWAGTGVQGFVLACLLVELGVLAVAGVHFSVRVGPVRFSADTAHWWALSLGGMPVALTALANTVNLRADVVMLGFLRSHREVGIYSAAFTGYLALGMFLNSFAVGFYPTLSALHWKREPEFGRLLRVAGALVLLAGLGLGALSALLARPALGMVFGSGFLEGQRALVILSLAVPFVGLQRLLGTALTAVGWPSYGLYAAGLGAICHVAANLALISDWGIDGAAAATVAGESVACAAALLLIRTALRKPPTPAPEPA